MLWIYINVVILLVTMTYSRAAPSESIKADCETCNWKYVSNKLDGFQKDGIVLDRCVQSGTLALTFDDGPYVSLTPGVLDVLKAENVTATFFVNGENYWPPLDHEEARVVLKHIRSDGHYIASHTWSHNYLTLQTTESINYEMNQLSNKLFEIIDERPTVMRPPYGIFNDTVVDIINGGMGYKLILWSICPCDWGNIGNPELSLLEYKKILDGTNPSITPGFISLHHDPVWGSAELASMAIRYVRSVGYRFVGLPECLGIPDGKL